MTTDDSSKQRMREQSDVERLQSEVVRLRERVDAAGAGQQDVYRRMEDLQGGRDDRLRDIESRLAALEKALSAAEAARAADRQQTIDELSRRMAGIMRAQPAGGGSRGVSGVEHVVQPGQTLSAIAAAYDVRIDAIMKANNLQNPNAIRAGQKLIVPD